MAQKRGRPAKVVEVAEVEPAEKETARTSAYTVQPAETSGFLVRHGTTPVTVQPTQEAAEAYVKMLERK